MKVETAINILIYIQGQRAGFELTAIRPWLPHLRNEVLLRLAEDLGNWACSEPFEEWRSYIPKFYGYRKDTRPHIARLLTGCCVATTAWKVKFFTSADVETLKDENAHWTCRDLPPLLVINADDLVQQIKSVCHGPLFFVRKRDISAC